MNYVLALHGGAGTVARGTDTTEHENAMHRALLAGQAVLQRGGSALDAVCATVVVLEDAPVFNAGVGAVMNADGDHELDAAVMEGAHLRAGGVAAVRRIRNPVLAARAMLEDGRHVLQVAHGAEQFAEHAGLAAVPNQHFFTRHRLAQLESVRASDASRSVLDHSMAGIPAAATNAVKFGTVGAVALDCLGNLAAATSTGGMTNKRPGRLGDSPVPGAGVYANNTTCAVSATGTGEHFLRASACYDVHARMAYGAQPLAMAAGATVHQNLQSLGGEGGLIAIGADGTLTFAFNSPGMYRGWVRQGEAAATQVFR